MDYFAGKTKTKPIEFIDDEEEFESQQYKEDSLEVETIPQLEWDQYGSPIKMAITLQQASTSISPVDETLLWTVNLPPPFWKVRPMNLVIRKSEFTFYEWATTSYPTTIHFAVDGMPGYYNSQGQQTTKIARFFLQQVTSGGTGAFNLTYSMDYDIKWQIPLSLSQFNLRVFFDESGTAETLPLASPISLCLDIFKNDPNDLKGEMELNFLQIYSENN